MAFFMSGTHYDTQESRRGTGYAPITVGKVLREGEMGASVHVLFSVYTLT